jgi:hypothetical protein
LIFVEKIAILIVYAFRRYFMDLDLIFKLAIAIVAVGVSVKLFKIVANMMFKVAIIAVVLIVIARLFM